MNDESTVQNLLDENHVDAGANADITEQGSILQTI